MAITYGKSGVNIEAGDALVSWLQKTGKKSPHQDKIVSGIGGFGAQFLFDFPKIKDPILVSCTDGVGTKVKLASHFGSYRGVGQDLVAMCLNDMICEGASPLFFLDYYASGKLNLDAAREFLQGVREACFECNCALIGGETAEMPGVYEKNDFDCAGFAVGVVGKKETLGAHRVEVGDVVVGVSSSGFHSNGYSLLRRVFADDLEEWKDVLLTPTALYVKLFEKIKGKVNALAHITGSGIENILRVLPANTCIELSDWEWPEPFLEVQRRSEMSDKEMLTTINCGLGLVIVCNKENAGFVKKEIKSAGFRSLDLGIVEKGKEKGEAYFLNRWK
ncbi:MAG: hypothetical protein A4S09_10275 [Proteobacteria bacterium SG_bin7]|nr:MAG: hypothetical protein A4S09_10275 [Proteobacteria bacterium SG_bin7]